jgi:hypothetical protein
MVSFFALFNRFKSFEFSIYKGEDYLSNLCILIDDSAFLTPLLAVLNTTLVKDLLGERLFRILSQL